MWNGHAFKSLNSHIMLFQDYFPSLVRDVDDWKSVYHKSDVDKVSWILLVQLNSLHSTNQCLFTDGAVLHLLFITGSSILRSRLDEYRYTFHWWREISLKLRDLRIEYLPIARIILDALYLRSFEKCCTFFLQVFYFWTLFFVIVFVCVCLDNASNK